MKKNIESFITSSNQLAAFLITQKFTYHPIKIDGTIKIELQGRDLTQAVEKFYHNADVPVQSYLAAFDTLRGAVALARSKHE